MFTRQFDVDFIHVHAEERYLALLRGVTEPEEKRRIIGTQFWKEFFAGGGGSGRGRASGEVPGAGDHLPGHHQVGRAQDRRQGVHHQVVITT